MVLRNCFIGSLILHIIILYGVGFCLPRLTDSGVTEKYFEVITPAAFSAENSRTDAIGELLSNSGATLRAKQTQREFQRVANSHPPGEPLQNNPTLKKPEIASVALETALPNEAPQSSKNISNPTGSFSGEPGESGITNLSGKPGASGGDGSDTGIAGNIHGLNGNPEGSGTGRVTGTEATLPAPDVPAVKIYYPGPEYPWKAKINNWEGTATLNIEILKNGKIGVIKIVKSSGYEILDQAALKTVKTWRYKPALKNGSAVIYYKNVDVRFQLEG